MSTQTAGAIQKNEILLRLSIPIDAEPIGKKFLEFCVEKFGGKSELFRTESLDKQTLKNLGDEFKLRAIELNKSYANTRVGSLLYRSQLGPVCNDFWFEGLHFVFVSEHELDQQEDEKLGEFFITKVFQLFNLVNRSQQSDDHWEGVNKSIMRKDPLDEIDYNSSSNYFIYEKD